jgi:hypothetical protein
MSTRRSTSGRPCPRRLLLARLAVAALALLSWPASRTRAASAADDAAAPLVPAAAHSPHGSAQPRVLVVSWSDRAAVHAEVYPALRAYCDLHGYEHRLVTGGSSAPSAAFRRLGGPPRAASWNKIELLVDAIDAAVESRAFDVVAWIDDDILITDAAQSLASLADRFGLFPPLPYSPAPPLILGGSDSLLRVSSGTGAYSSHPFNAGLMLVRASAKAAALLRLVWDAAPVLMPWALIHPVYEQEAFTLLWPALRKTVAVAAKRTLQSVDANFLPGDFAFHAAGMATAKRVARLADVAARCGATRRAAAGGPPLCTAPGFHGGARFASTQSMLTAMVGVQLGRSVAAVGAPIAGVYVLLVVASQLMPGCLYLVPRIAGRAADEDGGDVSLSPLIVAKLDEHAVNASRRAASDEGAAFFTTGFPRAPELLVVSHVASASSLFAAAAMAADSEAGATRTVASAMAAAGLSANSGVAAAAVAAATADAAVAAAAVDAAAAAPNEASVGGGAGGGLAAVLIFAPRYADDEQMAESLRTSAGLVRPASGVICVLGARVEFVSGTIAGACSRATLPRAQMLAALRSGGPASFRVAGASLAWEDEGEGDADFSAAAREAGESFAEAWAVNETARSAARQSWDCPAVCFAPS